MNADAERSAPAARREAVAGRRLVGAEIPDVGVSTTWGCVVLRQLADRLLVLFVFPHATGLPDEPVPGWSSIPGARGCTAQSCAFRDRLESFEAVGATVAGLSAQTLDEQRAFTVRVGLNYRLISDPDLRIARALGLPVFTASGRTFYQRLTLIAERRRVVDVFHPVANPDRNPDEVLAWLAHRPDSSAPDRRSSGGAATAGR